jgi:hypothetical protein
LQSLEKPKIPPHKFNFTVTLTVTTFCLMQKGGDRCRKQYLLCSESVQVVPSTPSPGLPVSNIKANDFRLIVLIQYVDGILMIRFFGSHEEYDGIDAETV